MTGLPDSAESGPSDAALVARVLDGDRAAFALVYDRYADRLYDFAHSMLRSREDASDAVADGFVLFAERLSQLREPDRLRPWLYAIVRSECLRRIKGRSRFAFGGDEQLVDMPDSALAPDEAVETAALRQLVWDAAEGLADRDRAMLDLHLRQGLDGAELGIAMGVSTSNAYVMMNRVRSQMERSLGALLIAKTGRDECSDLDDTLTNWDGSFSPLVRKRVARHVDNCATCTRRRAAMVSPLALFAGVSAFAAPAGLRERVLHSVPLPPPASVPSPWIRRGALAGTGAAVIVALLLILAGVIGDRSPEIKPVDTTSTPAPGSTAYSPTETPTPEPTPTESTSASAVQGRLVVSDSSLSISPRGTSASTTLTNRGGAALSYVLKPQDDWVSVSPTSGRLDVGQSRTITVRIDRGDRPTNDLTSRVDATWDHGTERINIRIGETEPPKVDVDPQVGSCSDGQRPVWARIGVDVDSDVKVRSVKVTWTGATSGSATLRGSRTVQVGYVPADSTVKFTATVRDSLDRRDSESATARVGHCDTEEPSEEPTEEPSPYPSDGPYIP